MNGDALADAAQSFVGVKFQLHGRDPATGLDCVGLCLAALARTGRVITIPACYGLRNRDVAHLLHHAGQAGLAISDGPIQPGDIVLIQPDMLHYHLLVAVSGDRFVHAHAGLRRVVALPGPLAAPIIRHWRLNPRN